MNEEQERKDLIFKLSKQREYLNKIFKFSFLGTGLVECSTLSYAFTFSKPIDEFLFEILLDCEKCETVDEVLEYLLMQSHLYENLPKVKIQNPLSENDFFLKAFLKHWAKMRDSTIQKEKEDIYFIQAENKFIKIGSSLKPEIRLKALQSSLFPFSGKLKILGIIPKGGREKEKDLQEIFGIYKVHGEWFEPNKEILKYIDENCIFPNWTIS